MSDQTFNSHSDSATSKFEKILIEMEQEASDTYDFSGIGEWQLMGRSTRRKYRAAVWDVVSF